MAWRGMLSERVESMHTCTHNELRGWNERETNEPLHTCASLLVSPSLAFTYVSFSCQSLHTNLFLHFFCIKHKTCIPHSGQDLHTCNAGCLCFSLSHRRRSRSCSYHYYTLHCSPPCTWISMTWLGSVGTCNVAVSREWDGHGRLVGRSVSW